jgi:hypothetical protein
MFEVANPSMVQDLIELDELKAVMEKPQPSPKL